MFELGTLVLLALFSSLLLAAAVLLLRSDGRVSYANPAAENLFELSRPKLVGHTPRELFGDCPVLLAAIGRAVLRGASYTEQELELGVSGKPKLHLTCTVSPVDGSDGTLLVIKPFECGTHRFGGSDCSRSVIG